MNEKKKEDHPNNMFDHEDRGGKPEGSTQDYEKKQSAPRDDHEYDTSKTKW